MTFEQGLLVDTEQKNANKESENKLIREQLGKTCAELEDLREVVQKLRRRNRELEAEARMIEAECSEILNKWNMQKLRIEEENQMLKAVSSDRLLENERLASSQGILLVKLALAYSELERLNNKCRG